MLVSSLFIGCDPLSLPLTLGSYGAVILADPKPTLGLLPLSVAKSNPQLLTPNQQTLGMKTEPS